MINKGMMSSNTAEWATPQWLFDLLNDEFNFDLDVCSTDENAKCKNHYTEEDDGLSKPWKGNVWCNPPYGRDIVKWVKKASESNLSGVTVMLLPARTETRWFIDYVYPFATELRFIYGRLKFNDEAGSAPFPSVVAIYDRRAKPWKAISL